MAPVLVAPFGLLIGSFLNVVTYRLPRGESLVHPPSHCTTCGTPVRPYDNVPVVSWLLLRGRCRRCRAPISARYPAVEALTAAAFALVAALDGIHPALALELPFAAMLIAVAAIDLDHHIIPNRILLPVALYGLAALAAIEPRQLPGHAIAASAGFACLLAIAIAKPGGMGMGDVKLVGVMGLYLGGALIPALLVAVLAGSVVGVAIVATAPPGERRRRGVPFGPFLALGGLVALVAGPDLIHLYTHAFLHAH